MPEVLLKIEWPDQKQDQVYSPSTIINQYFQKGATLSVADFEIKITEALTQASQRVYEKFGYECTSAMGELARVKQICNSISDRTGSIKIL